MFLCKGKPLCPRDLVNAHKIVEEENFNDYLRNRGTEPFKRKREEQNDNIGRVDKYGRYVKKSRQDSDEDDEMLESEDEMLESEERINQVPWQYKDVKIDKENDYFKYSDIKKYILECVTDSLKDLRRYPIKRKVYRKTNKLPAAVTEIEVKNVSDFDNAKKVEPIKIETNEKIVSAVNHDDKDNDEKDINVIEESKTKIEKSLPPPSSLSQQTAPEKKEILFPTSYPLDIIDETMRYVKSVVDPNTKHNISIWSSRYGSRSKTHLTAGRIYWNYDHDNNTWSKTDHSLMKVMQEYTNELTNESSTKTVPFDLKRDSSSPHDWNVSRGLLIKIK